MIPSRGQRHRPVDAAVFRAPFVGPPSRHHRPAWRADPVSGDEPHPAVVVTAGHARRLDRHVLR